jgi:hypothetical protein
MGARVKALLPVLLVAALAIVSTGSAAGEGQPAFGFTEDMTKYAEDGGAGFVATFHDLGVTENRVSVFWNPDRPGVIEEKPFLDRFIPQAKAGGITVVFSVYAKPGSGYAAAYASPAGMDSYVAFLVKVAQEYPYVTQFVVGNEPNQPRFWQPQFTSSGGVASAPAYTQLLAKSYDALKALNPAITVIGVGLSPRGNDNPKATSNASVSPVRFLKEMGETYRAMGRTAPLMDVLAVHIYPNRNTDSPAKGYVWPGIGFPNLDRLKQAFWDAFHDTAQPVFAEAGEPQAGKLPLKIDEIGWQTDIPGERRSLYSGEENVPLVSEAKQADFYRQAIGYALCEPSLEAALFFHLIDESDLARFQSGVLAVNGTRKPSYDAVKGAVGGSCGGEMASWSHRLDVVGASAVFDTRKASAKRRAWSMQLSADEGYSWRGAIIRLGSKSVAPGSDAVQAQIRSLILGAGKPAAGSAKLRLALRSQGQGAAARKIQASFPKRKLRPGRYVYAAVLSAAMNPDRTSLLVSKPFRVR